MNNVTEQINVEVVGAPLAVSPPCNTKGRVIAGYQLEERVGEGGFGTVWRAKAPGGMLKAVKLVHGRFDERRATEEFKSLEKIKDARHPFLLSLERIEVVDGQLIVVTELADESLKQRYDRCVAAGSPGVARDDLLRMLSEAADALDYMSKEHGLAHLDIKPENLLLVSDHVKVADFGLVKSVHTGGDSLIGGLTPLFAAPETFDGKPSDRSDQYSLAVVYQFALTGKLPFTGQSTAQLAAQHTTARPDLSSLPDVDRAIVERALEKDPFDRFETCRAFVDRLSAVKTAVVIPNTSQQDDAEPFHTELIEERLDGQSESTTGPIPGEEEAPIVDLPPLELEADALQRPTLVIGLGGCGAKMLSALTQRLTQQYGPCEAIPWFDSLLVDTDYDEFINSFAGEGQAQLSEKQFLHVPLKPTQYYRQHASELTRWLSRRWIYNIPKSQKPEGVRPLGRLALVDHVYQVEKQIDQAVSKLCHRKVENGSEGEGQSTLDHDNPQVFLVGSLSGGTGGAIFSDVAQLVRRAFGEQERTNPDIVCVLAHWSSSSAEAAELSTVNATAALAELHHLQTDGCPGDVTCHLPALGRHHGLFKHVYYVDLGWHSQRTSFLAAAEKLASYVECNMTPSLAHFGASCRESATESTRGISVARTFEIARLDASDLEKGSTTAKQLAKSVLEGFWAEGQSNELASEARQALEAIELEFQPAEIKRQIEQLNQERARSLLDEATTADGKLTCQLSIWKQRVEQAFPAQPKLRKPGENEADTVESAAAELLQRRTAALHQALIHAVEESPSPVGLCEQLIPQLCGQLEIAKRRPWHDADDESLSGENSDELTELIVCVEQAVARSTHGWLVQLIDFAQASLRSLLRRVVDAKRCVTRRISALAPLTGDSPTFEESLISSLNRSWRDWISTNYGGVGSFLLRSSIDVEAMERHLLTASRVHLMQRHMKDLTEAIQPAALGLGGARRVLIAAPQSVIDSDLLQSISSQLAHPPTLLPHDSCEVVLWCEGEQIKIGDIIKSLVGHRPELSELASQLHVRNDVAWAQP